MTVGRVVHLYLWTGTQHQGPFAATVASVLCDGTLNLGALDGAGQPFGRRAVKFGEQPGRDYCAWPPREQRGAS